MIYSQVNENRTMLDVFHRGRMFQLFPQRYISVHFSVFCVSFTFHFISVSSTFLLHFTFRFNSVLPHFSRLHVSESSSVNHLKRTCFTIEMKIVNESKDCSDLLFIDKFRLFETSLVLCLSMLAENEIPSVLKRKIALYISSFLGSLYFQYFDFSCTVL